MGGCFAEILFDTPDVFHIILCRFPLEMHVGCLEKCYIVADITGSSANNSQYRQYNSVNKNFTLLYVYPENMLRVPVKMVALVTLTPYNCTSLGNKHTIIQQT